MNTDALQVDFLGDLTLRRSKTLIRRIAAVRNGYAIAAAFIERILFGMVSLWARARWRTDAVSIM
jgi:hypothetical protein